MGHTADKLRLYFNPVREARKSHLLWIILPLVVCVAIMLPRLISPQFGMLDDGNTLTTASRIAAGDLSLNYEGERGRFRPMYWLVPTLVYVFTGAHPFWYFLSNLIVLILIVFFAMAFLRQLGVSAKQAALIGILFILTGSTMENVYTLSKGEPLMLLSIVLALYSSARLNSGKYSLKSLLAGSLLSTVFLFLADINKETALIILPITVGWLVVELLAARWLHRYPHLPWLISLFIGSVVSFSIYWLVRNSLVATSLQSGTYTMGYNFAVESMKASAIRWFGWLLRDDLYLLPLILFWLVASLVYKKAYKASEILFLAIWLVGWIAVYLPWWFAQEYYLFPFDLGVSILAVLLADQAWQALRQNSRLMSIFAVIGLSIFAIIWLVSMPNHFTDARIQLAVDSANQQMLNIMDKLPQDSSILLNIQSPNEYTAELDLLLRGVLGRSDIQINTFNPSMQQSADYVLTPFVQNRPLLTVRMGVSEPSLNQWVSSLQAYLGSGTQPLLRVEREVPLFIVDIPRVFCTFIPSRNFCATSRPLIDTRAFTYGWMLYSMEK